MPLDYGISGLASGMDTAKIIRKLVDLESRPIRRMENEIKKRQSENGAWEKIRNSLKKISSLSKTLYSFDSPFGLKIALSSHPDVIKATTNRFAQITTHNIKIYQLAARHRIASDPIGKKYKIDAGSFSLQVGKIKRNIYFPGGEISLLFNIIHKKAEKVVTASLINKDNKTYVLTLESKKFGKEGFIEITDEKGILKKIGFKKIKLQRSKDWVLDLDELSKMHQGTSEISFYNRGDSYLGRDFWFWERRHLEAFNEEPNISDKKKENKKSKGMITLRGKVHIGFPIEHFKIADGSKLIFSARPEYLKKRKIQKKPGQRQGPISSDTPDRVVSISKSREVDIGGNIFKGVIVDRKEKDFNTLREEATGKILESSKGKKSKKVKTLPEEDKWINGAVRLVFDDGKSKDFLYQASPAGKGDRDKNKNRENEIQLKEDLFPYIGKTVKAIEIINDTGTVSVLDVTLRPEKKESLSRYKNELARANDAVLEMGGVRLHRPKNTDLIDIIKGLTINLLKTSLDTVSIDVSVDTQKPKKAITELIEAYNNFLDLSASYRINSRENELGNYKRQKGNSGILVGDTTLGRLVSDLKLFSSSAYPGKGKKPIKILYQIGISTGKLNASFSDIKKGHLKIIDSDKLEKQLKENYLSVKDFFGSDTIGNRKINTGFAYRLTVYIKNYTKTGKFGLITAKLELGQRSIKIIKDNIKNRERHVEAYRDKLKRSFAAMEQGMLKTKSEQQWLGNQMKGLGNMQSKKN